MNPISISIALPPSDAVDEQVIRTCVAGALSLPVSRIAGLSVQRRSLDARSRNIKVMLQVQVSVDEPLPVPPPFDPELSDVVAAPPGFIIGAGPAGLFAALRLIALGVRPIILERGKDVRSRRRDLATINKEGLVNPESNYCFGEGGAGTYSDGKLYTRATKRGNVRRILQLFVHFGAPERILVDAHPHIGTNRLPQIVTAMREAIEACGGLVRFNTRLTDIHFRNGSVDAITVNENERITCQELILATGHSARDVFSLLHRRGVTIEAKPFALGVRVEHPQLIIDQAQYHCAQRPPWLPPAAYSLVAQEQGRGVFSFCMCPGGIIAPTATAPGELVVNGWSPSKRNNPYANSGTVVTVDEGDFMHYGFEGPLAAMRYQQMVERQAFKAGGGLLVAPAQRLTDFVTGKVSSSLPDCSYLPGVSPVDLRGVLPRAVYQALRAGILTFGKKMKGYLTAEAVMVATESRTSSPVRIPRDPHSLEHPQARGLYPCAEGAGYAGGIVSAAIDGDRCASLMAARILKR